MSKFFKIFGVVSASLLLILIVIITFIFVGGGDLDKESRLFADNIIARNVKEWKQPIEYDLLSIDFKKTITQGEFMIFWDKLSRVGEANTISEAVGEAFVHYQLGSGKEITASYKYDAKFKNCDAEILINLIQESEKWKVQGFRFYSKNGVSCL